MSVPFEGRGTLWGCFQFCSWLLIALELLGNSFLTSSLCSAFPALRQDQLCLRNFEIRGSRCISKGCGKRYKNFCAPNLRCGTTIVESFGLGLLRPSLGLPCTDPPCEDKVEDNELFLPSWSFPARRFSHFKFYHLAIKSLLIPTMPRAGLEP